MLLPIFAVIACLIWLYLLISHRGFWLANQRLCANRSLVSPEISWPDVVAIIPARNEENVLTSTLPTVLGQDYPGKFHVILVDDDSHDSTALVARTIGDYNTSSTISLEVVRNTPVPQGWVGKLWAMSNGLQRVATIAPETRYILFTDADIAYDNWVLRALVYKAEQEKRHLVSVMALLHCDSLWEHILVPAFVFFFQMLYPFHAVNDSRKATAGAAGGCMLVRCDSLHQIRNLSLIRDSIIDDCALAKLIKARGAIWLGFTPAVYSLRSYVSLRDIWLTVTRTAFTQLEYQATLLVYTLLGMGLAYMTEPITVVIGWSLGKWYTVFLGSVTWILMLIAYRPTLAFYQRRWWEGVILPLVAFLYTLMTIDSAVRFWLGYSQQWKGRILNYTRYHESRRDTVVTTVRKAHSSFFWPMVLLGHHKRDAMFAIYAFCRVIDNIADSAVDQAEKRAALALWREELELLYSGYPRHPIAVTLKKAINRFGLRYEDCLAIIEGVTMDVEGPLLAPSLEVLDLYCDRVSSAAGRLSVRVFGLPIVEGDHLSYALGRALQLTNILRDIAEDAENGRLYLPCDLLKAHGINITPPLSLSSILKHPALPEVCRVLSTIARHHFCEAEQILSRCPRWRARPAALMKAVYQAYLDILEEIDFQPLDHQRKKKIMIPLRKKLTLALYYMLVRCLF